jgi:hypothetical protein
VTIPPCPEGLGFLAALPVAKGPRSSNNLDFDGPSSKLGPRSQAGSTVHGPRYQVHQGTIAPQISSSLGRPNTWEPSAPRYAHDQESKVYWSMASLGTKSDDRSRYRVAIVIRAVDLASIAWIQGTKAPAVAWSLAGLGRPGHWVIKLPSVNGCQGTMKPSSMNDQSSPGTHSVDERKAASFEQDLGGMGTLDPWHRRRMGCQGPGQLGRWVPAEAWSLGRRGTLASRHQVE